MTKVITTQNTAAPWPSVMRSPPGTTPQTKKRPPCKVMNLESDVAVPILIFAICVSQTQIV